ncbi:hypothetical protein [Roseibium litorale]|uniref:DUF8051 domain-containing protein n=1 Tax=Roseibium litorale TaxID=2803841 RepID=A0ABR9CGP0_9HYPH|nr:hypothetical protein [Roseibium litorale]MBD8890040.1 hypothetical protein [Roseibium litorale]
MSGSRSCTLVLLLASALNLALMIPGGFVETRDFSAYTALILGAFNLFLTVLGLGSFVLAYMVWRQGRGFWLSALAGLGYVAVYQADLQGLFPVTPVPMPALLYLLEWLGTALGALLFLAGLAGIRTAQTTSGAGEKLPRPVLFGLVFAGGSIILFATLAAMGAI